MGAKAEKDAASASDEDKKVTKEQEKEEKGGFAFYFVCPSCTRNMQALTSEQRIFGYADRTTWILNSIAFLAAIASGTTLPLMTIVFGSSIGEFTSFGTGGSSPDAFNDKIRSLV